MVGRRAGDGTAPPASSDAVVAAARAGDQGAWRHLVAELGPAIRGFARARGIQEPDELTQEVFLDMSRSIATFDGDRTAFRSWVFTIAYRRVADHHRRVGRSPRTVNDDDHLRRRPAPDGLPEASAMASETLTELLAALDGMSELERDVLVLRFVGDLSSDQIAEVVGRTSGNVRVIQSRALQKLRKNLEPSCNTSPSRAIAPVT